MNPSPVGMIPQLFHEDGSSLKRPPTYGTTEPSLASEHVQVVISNRHRFVSIYILWYQYCWSFFIAFQALTLFCTIMFDSWSHNPTSGLSSAECSLSAQQILQQFETLECLKVPVLVISWWAKLIRKYCTRLIKIARSSVCLKDQLDCLICWIFAAVCTVATFRKSGSKLLCVTCNAKAAAQGSHTDSWGLPAKARTSSSQSPTSFAAQLQMLQRI